MLTVGASPRTMARMVISRTPRARAMRAEPWPMTCRARSRSRVPPASTRARRSDALVTVLRAPWWWPGWGGGGRWRGRGRWRGPGRRRPRWSGRCRPRRAAAGSGRGGVAGRGRRRQGCVRVGAGAGVTGAAGGCRSCQLAPSGWRSGGSAAGLGGAAGGVEGAGDLGFVEAGLAGGGGQRAEVGGVVGFQGAVGGPEQAGVAVALGLGGDPAGQRVDPLLPVAPWPGRGPLVARGRVPGGGRRRASPGRRAPPRASACW